MALGLAGYPPGAGNQTFTSVRPHLAPGKNITLRADARTFMFNLADEDDDSPTYAVNRPPGMPCGYYYIIHIFTSVSFFKSSIKLSLSLSLSLSLPHTLSQSYVTLHHLRASERWPFGN